MSGETSVSLTEALAWIASVFEEPAANVRENMLRDEIPAWDSLGILNLMAGLDEKFDIRLTEAELPAMKSVKDILDVLRRHGRLRPL